MCKRFSAKVMGMVTWQPAEKQRIVQLVQAPMLPSSICCKNRQEDPELMLSTKEAQTWEAIIPGLVADKIEFASFKSTGSMLGPNMLQMACLDF
jgi:hypothetical protein